MPERLNTRGKTIFRCLGLAGGTHGGGEAIVEVRDGKILRIRPFRFDLAYDKDELSSWKVERNGKSFEPRFISVPAAFSFAYKKRVYSPNRIRYPLMRVDWDPEGERNTQNRGKSKFRRISWSTAIDIIVKEITRIHETYGHNAILFQGDGHAENKTIHNAHGQPAILLERLGGYTQSVRSADSWEGWYWGAKHVWGEGWIGKMAPMTNLVKDTVEHTEMMLSWGCDPEATTGGLSGQTATRLLYYFKEIGIKQVYICPDLNHSAAVHADKWIPVLPNTDAALQLAIAFVWLKEGSYNKEYVGSHVVGFEEFKAYVLGDTDGVPKDPEWATTKCGVPEWTIKALAREFARKVTSIAHMFGGGMIRGPYSHEPARLEVCLLGMQGLGGPGVHQFSFWGVPQRKSLGKLFIADPENPERLLIPLLSSYGRWQEQVIPKALIHRALETEEQIPFWGTGAMNMPPMDQFREWHFPVAEEDGGCQVHMLWSDAPCRTTCWNAGNRQADALTLPKVETVIMQHPWLENDCLFADIILPVCTHMELDDIVRTEYPDSPMTNVMICEKGIEPVGEAKSDFEIVLEIAKPLGAEEGVTEGFSFETLRKKIFDACELEQYIGWDEFLQKGYYPAGVVEGWEEAPPGLRQFYEDPAEHRLPTPSGKLEFFSKRLAERFPDDQERQPIPKWIEKGETHDERLSSERARRYSLALMSNHSRWRVHAQCDDISWTREIPTCKVRGPDGYMYEPVWIHPTDAAVRGIKSGDIVKVFNERGIVLAGAYVTQRIRSGVVSIDHGARVDYIEPGKIDRGGAINTISPAGTTSKHCVGIATSGYLVEVGKVGPDEMADWREKHPEAFERAYDAAAGLKFEAWVEKGGKL